MAPGVDFAKGRLQFADMLYYKILEDIIEQEVLRLTAKDKQVDLSVSVAQIETVHVILFKVLLFKCSKYAGPLLIVFVLYYVAFLSNFFVSNKFILYKRVQCVTVQVCNALLFKALVTNCHLFFFRIFWSRRLFIIRCLLAVWRLFCLHTTHRSKGRL